MKSHSTSDDIIGRVAVIVAETLDMNADEIGPDSSMANVPSWDSMGQIDICMAIEKHYGKMFNLDMMDTATSVKSLAALIEEKQSGSRTP
jgi:acyl carrier protein